MKIQMQLYFRIVVQGQESADRTMQNKQRESK